MVAMARASLRDVTMTLPRRRSISRVHGFTLIELAVVVVIVGVLAVLALVGYRRLILSSKLTEARSMLGGIRVAQESYKAERGVYLNISKTAGCPTTAIADTSKLKTMWNGGCPSSGTQWKVLNVHADGPVQFQYFTISGTTEDGAVPDGFTAPTNIANLKGRPWYVAAARADLDGKSSDYTELLTTSQGGEIFVTNEGL